MGVRLIQDLGLVLLLAGAVALLCRRLNLSVVVGYVLAGVLIGPHTPPVQLVGDVERVSMLAELGLVFLIFTIGLDLSLKRLQRLGLSVALAVLVSSVLMLNLGRLLGLALGWDRTSSLFLASMLMVSSSAIISKVLEERGLTHERSSQLALGVTVLEDVVAVVMLTLLTSIVQFGEAGAGGVLPTLGSLLGFVTFLFVTALLVVPRSLAWLERRATPEMRNVLVVGVLLLLAWLAASVGYSAALSAFVLGAIIGGTRSRRSLERSLEGLRQVFGAVFFVSMGMLLELRQLLEAWPLVLATTAAALVARVAATSIGLIAAGHSLRTALRAGLNLTPIGEFSFIIAQLGVASAAAPESLYPIAIGMSILTAVVGPLLSQSAERLSLAIEERTPAFFRKWVEGYHQRLASGFSRPSWREGLRALTPIVLHVTLISTLLLSVEPLYVVAERRFGGAWLFPGDLKVLLSALLGVLLLAPLIAVWKHVARVALLVAGNLNPFVGLVLRIVAAILLFAWIFALLPFGLSVAGSLLAMVAGLFVVVAIAWPRLSRWHRSLEEELATQIWAAQAPAGAANLARALRERPSAWGLRLDEVALPELTPLAGRTIADLGIRARSGSSVVGIERRGFSILNPPRTERLFPGDRLLLLGTAQQLERADAFFRASGEEPERGTGFEELTLESHVVPEGSEADGRTLLELDLVRRFGVQVGGIERTTERLTAPNGTTVVHAGDEMLLIGTPRAIREFVTWMQPAPAAAARSGALEPEHEPAA